MAVTKSRRKTPATAPPESKTLMVRPSVVTTDATPVYYINNAEISSSAYEFGMAVARLPTKPSAEQMHEMRTDGVLNVEAELVLLMPPTLIPGLIRALNTQREVYEAQFGAIFDAGTDA